MAAASALDIVNGALNLLGAAKLAALDTTTEDGRKLSLIYEDARDELIRDLRPNFAKKRAIFHQVVNSEKTITGATAADPVVITSAAHGFSNDDVVAIWDVGGMTDLNGKMYIVQNVATNTFELTDLQGNDVDGTDFDTYTSGGKCGVVSASPAFGFTYRYALPSDYLMLLEIDENEDLTLPYSVEGGEILTDEEELRGRYLYQVSTVSSMDKDFIKLLQYKIAAEAAYAITNQTSIGEKWEQKYEKERARAKGRKSQESGYPQSGGPPRDIVHDEWLNSRNSGA